MSDNKLNQPYFADGTRNHLVPTDEQVQGLLDEVLEWAIQRELREERASADMIMANELTLVSPLLMTQE